MNTAHQAHCLPPMKRHSQRGIALILTLILLSVITFLTLAFLALSRREKGAVNVNLDDTRARQAAQAGIERAKAQIIAQILNQTNQWAYGLMVSTNYLNAHGFNPALGYNPTNVGFTYSNGARLNPADFVQNAANLYYDPRPPVFVETNRATGGLDFRYYLDLNRNGQYDTNGPILPVAQNGALLQTNLVHFTGDPEYVGITEDPTLPHSATNRFLERYAYVVLPAGKTFSLNSAHNQAKQIAPQQDGYLRNEGMGTWEMNLAAALEDLNTNYWGSSVSALNSYQPGLLNPSTGPAYLDALALLLYRYNGTYQTQPSARDVFGAANASFFPLDQLDEYGNGPLRTNASAFIPDVNDDIRLPWSGAENTNAFFNHQDLFDPLKTGAYVPVGQATFSDRLLAAGTNVNTYDRYTFYRLLSTMGLDAGPEPARKLNVNFVNVDGVSETNLAPWNPLDFFTNAIDRLLRDPRMHPYVGLSATNIPVYPTNYYTPAVHRLLQVAANIYDATTTNGWPSVFRPVFETRDTHIAIAGWRLVEDPAPLFDGTVRYLDLTNAASVGPDDMIAGIPLVIGAKKGLPSFNEFSLQTIFQAGRKLELRRLNTNSLPNETNQVYFIGVSNLFGLEVWNSYSNSYPRPLQMRAYIDIHWALTNELNILYPTNYTFTTPGQAWYTFPAIPANTWVGSPLNGRDYMDVTNGFRVPVSGGLVVLSNSAYLQFPAGGGLLGDINSPLPRTTSFPVPRLWLTTSARVRYALVDTALNRLVDFVNLGQLETHEDLTGHLMDLSAGEEPGVAVSMWRTNRIGGLAVNYPTEGIVNQLEVSKGNITTSLEDWKSYGGNSGNLRDKEKAIDAFRAFFKLTPLSTLGQLNPPVVTNLIIQAPYNPVRKFSFRSSWQANDPLVHYLPGDLAPTNYLPDLVTPPNSLPDDMLSNLGRLNRRTQPWGDNPLISTDPNRYNHRLKDPGMHRSDDWEFPNGLLANVGWLGRVHRGTPWQTIYLKADDLADLNWRYLDLRSLDRAIFDDAQQGSGSVLQTTLALWMNWAGRASLGSSPYPRLVHADHQDRYTLPASMDVLDALYQRPVNDRSLLEHFTATFDSRTTRGQLSVNNDSLAAWSALLSGVIVMSNNLPNAAFNDDSLPPSFAPVFIQSAGHDGTNAALTRLVAAINRSREKTNYFPKGVFEQLGDLLLVPELTTRSFYITNNDVQLKRGLTDAAIERIPQQVLGLLRGEDDPRFVIFAYGQALRPAPNSLVIGGPFNRLCTNYAITAEAAFRTVIRVENATTQPRAVVESFNFLPPD